MHYALSKEEPEDTVNNEKKEVECNDDGNDNDGTEKVKDNGSEVHFGSSEKEKIAKEIKESLEKHGINTSIAVKGTSDNK